MAGQTGEHLRFLLGRAESDLKTNKPAIKELKLKSKREKKYLLFRKSLFDVPEEETRTSVNS